MFDDKNLEYINSLDESAALTRLTSRLTQTPDPAANDKPSMFKSATEFNPFIQFVKTIVEKTHSVNKRICVYFKDVATWKSTFYKPDGAQALANFYVEYIKERNLHDGAEGQGPGKNKKLKQLFLNAIFGVGSASQMTSHLDVGVPFMRQFNTFSEMVEMNTANYEIGVILEIQTPVLDRFYKLMSDIKNDARIDDATLDDIREDLTNIFDHKKWYIASIYMPLAKRFAARIEKKNGFYDVGDWERYFNVQAVIAHRDDNLKNKAIQYWSNHHKDDMVSNPAETDEESVRREKYTDQDILEILKAYIRRNGEYLSPKTIIKFNDVLFGAPAISSYVLSGMGRDARPQWETLRKTLMNTQFSPKPKNSQGGKQGS